MLRVVFDTNIYLSALLFGGIPEKLVRDAQAGKFTLFASSDILHEVFSVLIKKFNYPPDQAKQTVTVIKNIALVVHPHITLEVIPNWPADNRILECAVTAKADYLVTGDKKHLLPLKKIENTRIVSVQEFLQICEV